ncbi:hypothetical protein SAMD00019534_045390 [Acytostelium subglobosum LB1]|uniref:hypothetical protein n=1 Tax=Acytostelium subglobosum LB1 TaxID=1410327 RepID=UPI000644E14E|nr:hypothetical protein SAMD00019534_045390 [Acytostelium subglobosum LB1]GAM21364.1 hypothetical protein SAMD00019534_045390 [Acytostelium subglobosum LB1]|eukprot:XP_012755483.1 hypothetical protein SAMD00019534_045390 [Acytostelium subglobosum LB1]
MLTTSSASSTANVPSSSATSLTLPLVIERISNSFYQIQHQLLSLTVEESKLRMFQSLNIKLLELSSQIEAKIEPIFTATLQGCIKSSSTEGLPVDILSTCLKVYQVIKKIHGPYRIFRKNIIKPHFTTGLEGNNKGSCDGLPTIYSNILSYLEKDCCTFFKVCSQVNSLFEATRYNFISESVLPEVDETLGQLKPVFATGMTDLFFKNYTCSSAFINRLEDLCTSMQQVKELRMSPTYSSLLKRWNFAVYFQLRFSEIAQQFERTLASINCIDILTGLQHPTEKNEHFLAQTGSLFGFLDMCWSPNIFIYDLSSKFFKLFLQLIARYEYFIQEALLHLEVAKGAAPGVHPDQKSLNKSTPQENLAYVYSDVLRLTTKINVHYRQVILRAIGNPLKEIESLVQDGLNLSVKSLDVLRERMSKLITDHFIAKCSESLSLISSIPPSYRMKNKPIPTKYSIYVPQIVNPLEAFYTNKANTIPLEYRALWSMDIFRPITERFLQNTNDVLLSVSKSDEMLNKMKKSLKSAATVPSSTTTSSLNNNTSTTTTNNTTTTTTTTANATDMQKISLQLYLDVIKYGQLIEKSGIDLHSFEPYIRLLEVVEPFKVYQQQPTTSNAISNDQ